MMILDLVSVLCSFALIPLTILTDTDSLNPGRSTKKAVSEVEKIPYSAWNSRFYMWNVSCSICFVQAWMVSVTG